MCYNQLSCYHLLRSDYCYYRKEAWKLFSVLGKIAAHLRGTLFYLIFILRSNEIFVQLDDEKILSNWTDHTKSNDLFSFRCKILVQPYRASHRLCSELYVTNREALTVLCSVIKFGYNARCHWLKERALWEFIIKFGYNACCHWLKERALWEYWA